MKEKIMTALKKQRKENSNVSDRSLEDLATSLSTIITTDELLEKADLSASLESLDGNINHVSAEAVKADQRRKEQEDARKKEEEKRRKEQEAIQNNQNTKKDGGDVTNQTPEWAKALIEQNKRMAERMDSMEKTKTQQTRLDKVKKTLSNTPDFFNKPIVTGFNRLSFETEEDFNEYLKEVENSKKTFEKQAKENGLNTTMPGQNVKKPDEDTGETEELHEAMKLAQKAKEKETENK